VFVFRVRLDRERVPGYHDLCGGDRRPSFPAPEPRTTVKYLTSRNADRPADDPILALNREAMQRRAAGLKTINATVGALLEDDGTLAVLPSVVEAIHNIEPARSAGYAPIAGAPDFLNAVIEDLLGGTSLASQAIAVSTPGGTGALRHAVNLFLDRGQHLVTPSFYWSPYATICEEHEREISTFAMFGDDGFLDVSAFASVLATTAARQGRLLVFLNDPCNNPTGYSMGDAEWVEVARMLANAASRVPLVLLCDVAYLEYARDSRGFLEFLAPLANSALLLFAWSASKSFTQYGLRVGALVACTADDEQRRAVQRALSFACRATWSNCNAGGQAAIARCLTDPALRARVDGERRRLTRLLDARAGAFNSAAKGTKLRCPRYDGGFFVTVFADDAAAAVEKLKAVGVFTVPQAGALRIALCGVAQADIPELVRALDQFL
jgi:aromatic-amino-acid transaminase